MICCRQWWRWRGSRILQGNTALQVLHLFSVFCIEQSYFFWLCGVVDTVICTLQGFFIIIIFTIHNNSCSTWYDLVSPVQFFFFYFSLSSHLQLTFTGFFHKDGKHVLIFTKYLCFVYFPMKEMTQKCLGVSEISTIFSCLKFGFALTPPYYS